MKNVKNNNGITLMALVITIIILIILASIGTYSGIQVVKSAQFTAFSTELKIMQTQVNKLYEEKKNGNDDVDDLGKTISGSTTVQTHATKAFNASGITDTSDYKYFDTETIKSLNIEGVEGEFFVNLDKRSVVSYDGFEYEGKTYYTLEQLPDGLYNVEYNTSEQQPDFNVDYELLENGKCKISVNNINYNGNINKWKIEYKKENEDDWKTSNSNSFIIDELGNYRVKIANGNIESNEKQIVAKSSLLPSEFQQVEYIESTGTQYIDTEINIQSGLTMECDIATVGESFVNSVIYDSKDSIYYMGWNPNNGLLYYIYLGNTRQSTMISLEANRMYHIKTVLKNGFQSMEVDGTVMKSTSISGDLIIEDKNLILFGGYDEAGKYLSKMRLGNIKYFNNNDILIRNYIPCYRKSDNKPGLYDLVEGKFYTNQGTGEFELPYGDYSLPSQYQKIEYLESTGTQYIDTGFAPNNNTKLEAKFSIDSTSINADRNYIVGTYSSNNVGRMQFSYSKNAFYGWGNQCNYSSTLNIDTDIHYLSLSKDSFLLDNTSVYTPTSNNFSLSSSIYLYCVNTSSGTDRLANGVKIYNCKIHDNNVLIRNFIPCKRKSDNKPGLYDLVNSEFYTNQGTGDFIKGDDVIVVIIQ